MLNFIVPASVPKIFKALFPRAPSAASIEKWLPAGCESRHAGTRAFEDQRAVPPPNPALLVPSLSADPGRFETYPATSPARGTVRLRDPRETRKLPRPDEMPALRRYVNAAFQSHRRPSAR